MGKTWQRIALAAAIACLLALTACTAPADNTQNDSCSGTETTAHTLYIGTASQHDKSVVMSVDDACSAVGNLALKYSDGYTIYPAKGGWKDGETGDVYTEDTVVLVVLDVSDEDVHALAKEAALMLDQKSVLVEHGKSTRELIE